jgi:hydrogenase expression/formation protein HypC
VCVGIPGQLVSLSTERPGLAEIEAGGVRRTVSTAMFDEGDLVVGCWVMVHLGFVMEVIEADDARTLMAELEGGPA